MMYKISLGTRFEMNLVIIFQLGRPLDKNIDIFQLISQENNPWLPKQLGSCQAWRKIDFGESQLRFSSRQFSKSSPVPELSRADPSPHQSYLRE